MPPTGGLIIGPFGNRDEDTAWILPDVNMCQQARAPCCLVVFGLQPARVAACVQFRSMRYSAMNSTCFEGEGARPRAAFPFCGLRLNWAAELEQ